MFFLFLFYSTISTKLAQFYQSLQLHSSRLLRQTACGLHLLLCRGGRVPWYDAGKDKANNRAFDRVSQSQCLLLPLRPPWRSDSWKLVHSCRKLSLSFPSPSFLTNPWFLSPQRSHHLAAPVFSLPLSYSGQLHIQAVQITLAGNCFPVDCYGPRPAQFQCHLV